MPMGDYVLDNGLAALDTLASHIYLTHTLATTFTEATSTYAVANKNFGAGAAVGAPAARAPNGRKVATTAVTDGNVTSTNASPGAGFYAIVDSTNSRLLIAAPLSAAQPVTSGNTFQLPSFDIGIPNQ